MSSYEFLEYFYISTPIRHLFHNSPPSPSKTSKKKEYLPTPQTENQRKQSQDGPPFGLRSLAVTEILPCILYYLQTVHINFCLMTTHK